MAKFKLTNPANAPGPLFVDTTCIDCGTCFHLGPEIFKEENDTSIVQAQPTSISQWAQAKAAIISCPTNSIGVTTSNFEFKSATELLPLHIQEDIYYCGYTARSSFGASSYLIKRPEGNILVDSPRFHPHLVKKLEELGGVDYLFLTHRDDVADHVQFSEHFKCSRIIHRLEVEGSTNASEMILSGEGDWDFAPDVKIIFTPGHTQGHLTLLYKNEFMFTGDHLFYSAEKDKVYASKSVSWYSWKIQLGSIQKLLNYHFSWIMPGHGGWIHREDKLIKEDLQEVLKKG